MTTRRYQINARCTRDDLELFRKSAEKLGYTEREFGSWIRDACRLYAGLVVLEDQAQQAIVKLGQEHLRALTWPLERQIDRLKSRLGGYRKKEAASDSSAIE